MDTAQAAAPFRDHTMTVSVDYGRDDVERAADSLQVVLSDAEVEAILDDVNGELPTLASAALRAALLTRIDDDLARTVRGHSWSDDD